VETAAEAIGRTRAPAFASVRRPVHDDRPDSRTVALIAHDAEMRALLGLARAPSTPSCAGNCSDRDDRSVLTETSACRPRRSPAARRGEISRSEPELLRATSMA
jgi:hypothetical protein